LIIGARKFLFSAAAQGSSRLQWWEAAPDGKSEIIPRGLKLVLVRQGLARAKQAEEIAKGRGAELVQFAADHEIFPRLGALLGINCDRAKDGAAPAEAPDEAEALPAEDLQLKIDRVIDIPVGRIRPFKGQPRIHFNADRLRALGRSIARAGQKVPIIVVPVEGDRNADYQIYDGERRWRAAQIVHKPTVRAIVASSASEAEMFKGSAVCNFGREDHQPIEVALAIKRIRQAEPETTLAEIADMFSRSGAWAGQHLGLLKLVPSVQARVNTDLPEGEQILFSTALELARLPADRQEEAAAHILKQRLSISKTRWYIRHLTVQLGVPSFRHRRTPRDDVRGLKRFVERTLADADNFMNLPGLTMEALFRHRAESERREVIARLGAGIEKLRAMQAAIAGKSRPGK
jgi:ParB/RepB/Spo0J family partition protein